MSAGQRAAPRTVAPATGEKFAGDDLLWRHLKSVPAFRALLRAVEARFYQQLDFPEPVLDVGCGDGHFAEMTFGSPLTAGVDPWWGPLNKAEQTGMYETLAQGMGDYMPYPDRTFASAFSNSVLEHIPDIEPVLVEVNRVLQYEGQFVMTMPSHLFTEHLGGAQFFERLGLDGMAERYRGFFNTISRHAHTDHPEVWAARLARAGFVIDRWQYYFSEAALRELELGHAYGVPSAVLHALTGHWILGPWESNLRPVERRLRPLYEEPFPNEGAYLFIVARKVAEEPIEAPLPPARPFTPAELAEAPAETAGAMGMAAAAAGALVTGHAVAGADGDGLAVNTAPVEAVPEASGGATGVATGEEPVEARRGRGLSGLAAGLLVLATLVAGFMAQAAWRANPEQPGAGLGWLAIAALGLLGLTWQQRERGGRGWQAVRLPSLRDMPRQRWLYFVALLVVFVAQRLAAPVPRPALALLFWLAGVGLAFYALYPVARAQGQVWRWPARETVLASTLLFGGALAVRLYDLAQHPFILNGTEASMGLEAMTIVDGVARNPFGTGWLTNPNLPFFVLAVPLRVFGAEVWTLRLTSAIVGAVTVPAVYWFGKRLFGRAVGVVAAVLLLGSHFHVHFSRLGLTNVWDGLLVLLALGLVGVAWQQTEPARRRVVWLLAGLAIGLNAFLFTSSRVLPLMLIVLLVLTLIFERDKLAAHGRHAIAAAALALVVALPQLLYYRMNPGIFMERANALGILESQGGWLAREAAQSGATQLDLLQQQLWVAMVGFNAALDTSTAYGPLVPLVSAGLGLFFILGFVWALLHVRQLRYNLFTVWVAVVVVFAGALLENPPASHRYIVAAPAVVMLAGLALVALGRFVSRLTRQDEADVDAGRARLTTAVFWGVLAVAVLVMAAELVTYFGPYRTQHRFADRNTEVADVMAGYLNSLDGEAWTAYFYGPPSMYVGFPTIPFLVRDFEEGQNLFDVVDAAALPASEDAQQTFIFLPERYGELDALRARYPGGRETAFSGYYADPLFYVYEVGAES